MIQRFTATGFNENNRCAEVSADDHGAWVLHDDVAELQRDADRYRWLRKQERLRDGTETGGLYVGVESADVWGLAGEEADEAIDAAMSNA